MFMPIPYCYSYYDFAMYFEIWKCDVFSFVLSQDHFGYSEVFVIPYEFQGRFSPPIFVKKKKKKCLWDFIAASIELVDWFGL